MRVTYVNCICDRSAQGEDPDLAIRSIEVASLEELIELRRKHTQDPGFRFLPPFETQLLNSFIVEPCKRRGRPPRKSQSDPASPDYPDQPGHQ